METVVLRAETRHIKICNAQTLLIQNCGSKVWSEGNFVLYMERRKVVIKKTTM
jgi:hypothetical protein